MEPTESAVEPASPRTAVGVGAAGLAGLLPVAFSTSFDTAAWGPKYALMLLLAGLGLPFLARERSGAGIAAAAFLALATVSTVLSDNPGMALVGLWNWGTGLLLVAASVGAWAIGRKLTDRDRMLLERGLIAAGLVLVVITLLQVSLGLAAFGILEKFGQPTALMGNPVYLSAVLALPAALAIWHAATKSQWVVLVAVFSMGVSLTRTRAAVAVLVLLALVQVRRNWRSILPLAGVIGGWIAGALLVALVTLEPGGTGSASGATVATVTAETYVSREGPGPRIQNWLLALEPFREKPLLGAGPGRFLAATSPHRTADFSRENPGEYYADGHNFVVEYAVTTGVLGVVALGAWLFLAARGARGAFGLAALAGGLIHLVHPQHVAFTPLALLCLGAAAPRGMTAPTSRASWERVALAGVSLGAVVLAAVFLVGQLQMRQAYLELDETASGSAYRLLPFWPEVAQRRALVAAGEVALAPGQDSNWSTARRYFREATRRDPQDPRVWVTLGNFERSRGEVAAATAAYRRALSVDPWSPAALAGLASAAEFQRDSAGQRQWERRLRQVVPETKEGAP